MTFPTSSTEQVAEREDLALITLRGQIAVIAEMLLDGPGDRGANKAPWPEGLMRAGAPRRLIWATALTWACILQAPGASSEKSWLKLPICGHAIHTFHPRL